MALLYEEMHLGHLSSVVAVLAEEAATAFPPWLMLITHATSESAQEGVHALCLPSLAFAACMVQATQPG